MRAVPDLSRRRLDVCLLDDAGELVEYTAPPPDVDGLRHLAERLQSERVRAVIESMTGARFIHDTLEELGWSCWSPTRRRSRGSRRRRARPTRSTRACWPSCPGALVPDAQVQRLAERRDASELPPADRKLRGGDGR
jgi:hypothetical protein